MPVDNTANPSQSNRPPPESRVFGRKISNPTAAAVGAGGALGDLPEAGGFFFAGVLEHGEIEGVGEAVEGLGIEGGGDLGDGEEVADAVDAFGELGILRELAGDGVFGAEEAVEGVEEALTVGGVEDIPGDEESFAMLDRGCLKPLLEFELGVDWGGFERDRVGHEN